jgi:uncharacterized protein (DUF2336 family)
MPLSRHQSLQGLVELARRDGVEIRPTLLRVLVDLYVQEAVHTASEAARFTELVSRLLDHADLATRAGVAQRLAAYSGTPPAVALKLARDEMAVAEPLLRQSRALGAAELHEVLDLKSVPHAIAVATRPDLPESVADRIAGRTSAARVEAQATPDQPIALRFLEAGEAERQGIFAALERLGPPELEAWRRDIHSSVIERLERAALGQQRAEFARILDHSVGIPIEVASRIVADAGGEPLLVVLRALRTPPETVHRVLLFLNPEIGQSVPRVFALAQLYEKLAEPVAQYLAQGWRRAPRRPQHMPQVALDASDRRDARAVHRDTRAPASMPADRRTRADER